MEVIPVLRRHHVSWDLQRQTTKLEMVRSVYEGIVFSHKQHLDKLEKNLGKRPDVIRISGGGTKFKTMVSKFFLIF